VSTDKPQPGDDGLIWLEPGRKDLRGRYEAADTPASLPYPHARNDCGMCGERDADFHVLGAEWNRPETGYQTLLCQACFGRWLSTPVYILSPGREGHPVTVTVEIPAARLADHGLPSPGDDPHGH
jgi:hypothetical protein